jgi:RNA polymerase sporulation-specific sigma factor
VGFLKAIEGFDMDYGTCFSTYAVPKIAGEIRRFLRDDGSVKLSRGVKERAARVARARAELEQELGREPCLSELSARTGLEAEEIAAAETAVSAARSLEQEAGEEGFTLLDTLSDPEAEARLLEHVALREGLDALPERERQVLLLRFFRGLTQQAAAERLGVSQVQISRLERRALRALRDYVE